MLARLTLLLAGLATMLAAAPPPPAIRRASIAQHCNGDPSTHCIYTPPQESIADCGCLPVKVFRGQAIDQQVDAIGSITYLLTESASAYTTVKCAKGGGENFFVIYMDKDYSSIQHYPNSTGLATMGFNDGSGAHVRPHDQATPQTSVHYLRCVCLGFIPQPAPGSTVSTRMRGVDATVHCPF
ncbi:hypothetical protein BDZ90DRAFT_43872 [Jaminaea rosea]|uniref:Cell wall protein YJL171C/Tos1 C-terminal domain-containing protein n=1 Tax=Jaminaea rosea TaxID=1569628 RepID=A0A316UNT3_9BASI|nr:hypothetical protein BDZ90DRAFT_43872 [Jaminaea rosea]PWN26614.1 hypothetical protein BDZ90DRAFT_43872 [Jaminaea rosea]